MKPSFSLLYTKWNHHSVYNRHSETIILSIIEWNMIYLLPQVSSIRTPLELSLNTCNHISCDRTQYDLSQKAYKQFYLLLGTSLHRTCSILVRGGSRGSPTGFFYKGGPTFAHKITKIQSLSTFKQMLAVCICFNKR